MDREKEAAEIRIAIEAWMVGTDLQGFAPRPFHILGVDGVHQNPTSHSWSAAVLVRVPADDSEKIRNIRILGFTITDLVRMRYLLDALNLSVDELLQREGLR